MNKNKVSKNLGGVTDFLGGSLPPPKKKKRACRKPCMMHTYTGPRVSYRGGGTGGIYPPHDFGKGGYPPIKLQNSVFLMGILVKSFKKVFRRQIPFF